MMEKNCDDALAAILKQAELERWCTKWNCTTCGADRLRDAIMQAFGMAGILSEQAATRLVQQMQMQPPSLMGEPAVFVLRWMATVLSREAIATQLADGPAADLFREMLSDRAETAKRRADYLLRNSASYVAEQRAAKKLEKALKHEKRLQEKMARDRDRMSGQENFPNPPAD